MNMPIYMDYAATTPVDPQVAAKMMSCLTQDGIFGNPASRSHSYGWLAAEEVDKARCDIADLIGADHREIIFTSGATESDNMALKGCAFANAAKGRHIITSAIEHKAVLDTCHFLETQGFRVTYLKPRKDGIIQPQQVEDALEPDTILVSIMQVNNELGSINDIASIGSLCRSRGIIFHSDAAQSLGKVAIDVKQMPVDLLSLSAHKIYGPKGIGAIYIRRSPDVKVAPLIHGGGHERGYRSGTLATHQIVGMGQACLLARQAFTTDVPRISTLRDELERKLLTLPGVSINGSRTSRVCGLLNVSFAGVDGDVLISSLKDVAVSSGSACTSASVEPSYVLTAIGLSRELAYSSIRFSLGRFTTLAEIDLVFKTLIRVLSALR